MLSEGSTLGGYALYLGDENWILTDLSKQGSNTFGDAVAVNMGTAQLDQVTAKGWSARMYVTTNLSGANPNQYALGNPCAGNHLIAVNKGRGLDDNCLTVDADTGDLGPQKVTLLVLRITHSKSSGRKYRIALIMNLETLPGLSGTKPSDWTAAAVAAIPERAAFVQRLQQWGTVLQDASERALDFKQPQDAFANIPSYRTLAPEPDAAAPSQ